MDGTLEYGMKITWLTTLNSKSVSALKWNPQLKLQLFWLRFEIYKEFQKQIMNWKWKRVKCGVEYFGRPCYFTSSFKLSILGPIWLFFFGK